MNARLDARGKAVRLAGVALAAAGLASCLYLPPMTRTSGFTQLTSIERGRTTRADVQDKLPNWPALRKADVWVFAWQQSHGYLVAGYSGGVEFTGPRFSALVRFDGDVVRDFEFRSSRTERHADSLAPERVLEPRSVRADGSGTCLATVPGKDDCLVAFGTDGTLFVAADGPERGRIALPWKPKAIEVAEGKPPRSPAEVVAVTADGSAVIVRRRFNKQYVLDLRARRPAPLPEDAHPPFAFAPDGKLLATGGRDGALVFIATGTWSEVGRIEPIDYVNDVSFAAAAPVAVVTGSHGDVAVVEVPSGNVRLRMLGAGHVRGRTMALSPDGRRLALATWADLEIWDVSALEADAARGPFRFLDDGPASALVAAVLLPIDPFPGPAEPVFSDDGRFVFARAGDRGLLVRADGSVVGMLRCGFAPRSLRREAGQGLVVRGAAARATFDVD